MAKGKERDGRREAWWRRQVGGQQRSGLSIREFCRKSNLRETAFYFWRRELVRRDAERRKGEQEQRRQQQQQGRRWRIQRGPAPAFLRVKVMPADTARGHDGSAGRIEIELPGGRRVHVHAPVDRQALADVLAVLEGLPSAEEGRSC